MIKARLGGLRMLEKLGLVTALAALVYVGWLHETNTAFSLEIAIGAFSVFIFGFVLFFLTSRLISKRIELLSVQSDFTNNTQFLSLFERSPVPYITVDKKGKIQNINQAGVNLLQSTIDSLLNSNFFDRLIASEQSDVSIISHKIKAGITLNDLELAIRPDEHDDIWVLLSSYSNPQTDQTLISLVNITQAKKVDEAKSEFVALATHQLRTPIAAIRWNTELLKKRIPENIKDELDRYFVKVERNIERMTSLINDFLNVSKLELGTFASEPKEINLKDFIDNSVDELIDKFEQKFISLERKELEPEFTFVTDERLFQIIISNLLSNASKYVKESGTIWLTTSLDENQLHIQIADNGIGIPKNEVDSLFTKFYRATNAKSHQTEGTGLGLYIVKQAVEQLHGTISVMSDTEKGAAFSIMLPLSKQV